MYLFLKDYLKIFIFLKKEINLIDKFLLLEKRNKMVILNKINN